MNPDGVKRLPLLKIREAGGTGRNNATGWQEVPTAAVAGRPVRTKMAGAKGVHGVDRGGMPIYQPGLKPQAAMAGLQTAPIPGAATGIRCRAGRGPRNLTYCVLLQEGKLS